jgi:uncharacterized protein YoxC
MAAANVTVILRFVLDDRTERKLDRIIASLDRVERDLATIITKENTLMETIHDDIAASFGPVVDAVSQVSTDVATALADLALQLAPRMTDEEKARFAGVAQQLLDLDATVKAADPGDGSTPPAGDAGGEAPPTE